MIFLVAEIGVNWDGNFELAKKMMEEAKSAGCNAVKFQAFNEEMVKNHPGKNRLIRTAISENNIEKIDNMAKFVGIEWFCTPMYPEAVSMLNPFVRRFKIRFGDGKMLLENKKTDLFNKILETKKEVIISSEKSPRNTIFFDKHQVKWLYVVPKYPCEFNDLDFRNLGDFDGYSNHCPHFLAPLTAVLLGAKIIEVHITSDKSKDFLDNNVSFDYSELKQLTTLIRLAEKIKR